MYSKVQQMITYLSSAPLFGQETAVETETASKKCAAKLKGQISELVLYTMSQSASLYCIR